MSSPYPAQPPRRLERSKSNRILGGVCAGVANYLNMDPTLVRVLTVVISLFTGVPVILYIIALFVSTRGRFSAGNSDLSAGRGSAAGWVPVSTATDRWLSDSTAAKCAAGVRTILANSGFSATSPTSLGRGLHLGQRGRTLGTAPTTCPGTHCGV